MPSSYEGKWGKITYSLKAQLTQSIWLVHKTKTRFPFLTKSEFPFASKSEMIIIGLKVWNRLASVCECVFFFSRVCSCYNNHPFQLMPYVCTCQEQQSVTRISFYGSAKVALNVSSEKLGVKQGKQILLKT